MFVYAAGDKINFLNVEWMEDKSTSVHVGTGGVTVNVEPHNGGGVHVTKSKPGGGHTNVNVGPKGGVGVSTDGGHTSVGVGPRGGVGVTTGTPGGGHANVNVHPKGGVGVSVGKPGKRPIYVGVRPGPSPFNYEYAATETQLHDDPTRALFFLEKDMKPGSHMTLHFTQSTNGATFLPREEADPLPFSSNKMTDILRAFAIQPDSEEAHIMEDTVKECEAKGIQGEQKHCATSLESMVEYATSTLGKNTKAISTQVNEEKHKVRYTISGVRKVGGDDKVVACHKKNYVYAVFYCHRTKATSAYVLSLASADGSTTKAVAVCHKDTSAWNPKHLAFKVLNVKPGSVPICHFLPEDHIVWVPDTN